MSFFARFMLVARNLYDKSSNESKEAELAIRELLYAGKMTLYRLILKVALCLSQGIVWSFLRCTHFNFVCEKYMQGSSSVTLLYLNFFEVFGRVLLKQLRGYVEKHNWKAEMGKGSFLEKTLLSCCETQFLSDSRNKFEANL